MLKAIHVIRQMRLLSVHTAGLAALISGASFVAAEGSLVFAADTDHWDCNSGSDLWVNGLYLLGFLLLAPAILGIHRQQATRARRWGEVAAFLAAIGAVTTGIVNAAEHCLHLPIGLLFVTGGLITVVALAVFTVSIIGSGVLPKWMGATILFGTLALQVAGQQGGIYVFGVAWIAVGSALLTRRDRLAAIPLGDR